MTTTNHISPRRTRSARAAARRSVPALIRLVRAGVRLTGYLGSVLPTPRPKPEPVSATRLRVSVVDDPTSTFRLVGAYGPLDRLTVLDLLDSLDDLRRGDSLHLDLTGLDTIDPVSLGRVEAMIDELELDGVSVRIVGIDPEHPALRHRTHLR